MPWVLDTMDSYPAWGSPTAYDEDDLDPGALPGIQVAVDPEPLRDEPDKYRQALMREDRRRRRRSVFAWGRANRAILPLLRLDHDIAEEIRMRLIFTGAKFGLSGKQVSLLRHLKELLASEEGR